MPHGAYHPGPWRSGARSTVEALTKGLDAGLGDAYDTTEDSPAHVESIAMARAVAEVWDTNQRLANQFDPSRITTFLERWEKILKLAPLSTDSDIDRRAQIVERFLDFGADMTYQRTVDILEAALGSYFVAVHHIAPADANIHWPGDGSETADSPWTSTVCHIPIQTQLVSLPSERNSEASFLEAVGHVYQELGDRIPAWAKFDWYRDGTGHGAGAWSEDSGAGFYLDEDPPNYNLNYQVFDE